MTIRTWLVGQTLASTRRTAFNTSESAVEWAVKVADAALKLLNQE